MWTASAYLIADRDATLRVAVGQEPTESSTGDKRSMSTSRRSSEITSAKEHDMCARRQLDKNEAVIVR